MTQRFRTYDLARQLLPAVADAASQIAKHDADLARQLRRAYSSAVLNLAEGAGCRGARRRNHYTIALGSARESLACIHVASAFGYLEATLALEDRLDKLCAWIYRLIHSRALRTRE